MIFLFYNKTTLYTFIYMVWYIMFIDIYVVVGNVEFLIRFNNLSNLNIKLILYAMCYTKNFFILF